MQLCLFYSISQIEFILVYCLHVYTECWKTDLCGWQPIWLQLQGYSAANNSPDINLPLLDSIPWNIVFNTCQLGQLGNRIHLPIANFYLSLYQILSSAGHFYCLSYLSLYYIVNQAVVTCKHCGVIGRSREDLNFCKVVIMDLKCSHLYSNRPWNVISRSILSASSLPDNNAVSW